MANNPTVAENTKSKGSKSKIIIIALAIVILLLGGFIGYSLMSGSGEIPFISKFFEEPEPVEVQVPLDEFLINVPDKNGDDTAIVKLEVSVSSYEEGAEELIGKEIAKVRDAIIHVVSNENIDTLLKREDNSFVIKNDLKNRINEAFGKDIIHKVYITNILTQD
ncbi:flagellar basal body-associated FliL family protein [Marinilactibacillus psychrotolerans]|uniref:Flagellar protein FliL n=1 Tax=Marinilactibacillus psychrotolerans TaxID=191770 RepID=A0AAV3WVY6_9LACT|nr:flagellar basal body-associated FliL family protein [Marinilactibacillus psychrotolerans]GEL66218.1 hypothetical protein MPS01_03730 [Marinilactibacillus psychrotolerans]GEQ35039.1 hypothetical protein M132T_05470 [Marinilactibacillus psychrotolerans]SDC26797.1 flagellar FliL protein [Marinilactibacillus psychrotolerans]